MDAAFFKLPFRNDSGATIPAFGAMRCTGGALVAGQAVLTMDKPNSQFQRYWYVNGVVDVAADGYGDCVGPECPAIFVLYDHGEGDDAPQPAAGQSWGPAANANVATSNRPGFSILGPTVTDSTAGESNTIYRVLVRPDVTDDVWVQLDQPLPQGGSVSAPVFIGQPAGMSGGGETDSSMTITLYDRLIDPDTQPGWKLPTGAWVHASWIDGFWYAVESSKCAVPAAGYS